MADGPDSGEIEALNLLAQDHPWQLTVEMLAGRLRWLRDLQIEIHEEEDGLYLKRGRRICSLPGIGRNEVLALDVLDQIVSALSLSWSDLQLDPPTDED